MPVYVYKCSRCNVLWEEAHSMRDDEQRLHGPCGMIAMRVPQPTGVVLNGDGWAGKESV